MQQTAKKLLLSFSLVIAFVIYTFYGRSSGAGRPTPFKPLSSVSNILSPSYKNGEYIGDVADAYYGNIQVKAIIKNGSIADVQFLQYPNDRNTSIAINTEAMPILRSEAIQKQDAQVDVVSGATQTSEAFVQSLASALKKAKS